MKKIITLLLIISMLLLSLTACKKNDNDDASSGEITGGDSGDGGSGDTDSSGEPTFIPENSFVATHTATITIKDLGVVTLDLYGNAAPITVANFVKLANEGFYDGLTFHRIMDGFMAQGGCPKGNGRGDCGTDIKGEFYANGVANPVMHERGIISMARASDPNSASSQFFIVHKTSMNNSYSLDGRYAAFGKVTSGMDVIDTMIENVLKKGYTETVPAADQPVIESIVAVEKAPEPLPENVFDVTHNATIKIKGYGEVKLELYGNAAPITVANFAKLANEGFYNGLTFHRIIDGFMAQGGCPNGTGSGGSGTDIKGEFYTNGVANPIMHRRGTISMARATDPDTASSQFFIVHESSFDNSFSLDGRYAAFGKVTSGMEFIDAMIKGVTVGNNGSVAAENQPVIESITVSEVK